MAGRLSPHQPRQGVFSYGHGQATGVSVGVLSPDREAVQHRRSLRSHSVDQVASVLPPTSSPSGKIPYCFSLSS